jgi:hypothetical protein
MMAAATSDPDVTRRHAELLKIVDDARDCPDGCGGSSAALALALHELEGRGWRIIAALDDDALDQAAETIEQADAHVCAVLRRGELEAVTALLARCQRRGWALLLDADGCNILLRRAISSRLRSRTIRAGIQAARRA